MTHELTPAEHRAQRDLVARSMFLADTPEERHGTYAKRPPRVVRPRHVYRLPVVTERPL